MHTLPDYLCFFSGLTLDREWSCPFFVHIGPKWLFDIVTDKKGKSSTAFQAWSNILTGREIYISSAKSAAHVEVYCLAQFARQLGFVQAIPIPYCGSANLSLSSCSIIPIDQFRLRFADSKQRLRTNIVQAFKEPETGTTPEFDSWWHENCAFLFGYRPFKNFLKHIGFDNSKFGSKNPNSSFSSKCDFGIAEGLEDMAEDEVNQKKIPIAAQPISVSFPSPPPRRHSSRISKKQGMFFFSQILNYLKYCICF